MRRLFALVFWGAVAVLSGCRTTKDILNDYEANLAYGKYAEAAREVSAKADEGGVDALVWQLHAANAKSLAVDTSGAIHRYDLAENIFLKNDRQSVFSRGGDGAYAMMTNDRVFPYAGGGQDRIFTCLYKAIDYGASGRNDAMRTELNRAAQHQENWLVERRKDIDAAGERLKKDADAYQRENAKSGNRASVAEAEGAVGKALSNSTFNEKVYAASGFNPETDGRLETLSTKDYMNVYVQSVCGLFRWLSGEADGQYFLRDAAALKPENAMLKQDFASASSSIRPKNTVWVFVEDGLCPVREEWRMDLPLFLIPGLNRYVKYAGMALPKLRYRNAAVTAYSASAGSQSVQMTELESIDRLMKTEFDVYMRGALTREITRVIVKAGVQIALGVVADGVNDDYTRVALKASQLAAAAWAASVTAADVRSWTSLPKSVHACRLQRPADGVIKINCGLEQIPITIPEGNAMVFVRKPSSAAASVAKVVMFSN